MHHRKAGCKLKRNVSARRGLVTNVIEEERVTTTIPKAKAAKPLMKRMITLAKEGHTAQPQPGRSVIAEARSYHEAVRQDRPRLNQRAGGYSRIIKLGWRKGDGAERLSSNWLAPNWSSKESSALPAVKSASKLRTATATPANKHP